MAMSLIDQLPITPGAWGWPKIVAKRATKSGGSFRRRVPNLPSSATNHTGNLKPIWGTAASRRSPNHPRFSLPEMGATACLAELGSTDIHFI